MTLPNFLIDDIFETTKTLTCWIKTSESGVLIYAADNSNTQGDPGFATPFLYVGQDGLARATTYPLLTGGAAPPTPLTSSTTVNDDNWHHLAFVVGTASQTFYVDGTAVGTAPYGLQLAGRPYTMLGIGYCGSGSAIFPSCPEGWFAYNGLLDNVRIYQRALTASDVAALYNAGNGSTDALPNCTLTAPTTGSCYTTPGPVTLTANAWEVNGNISKVDYYQGSTLIGEVTSNASGNWSYSFGLVARHRLRGADVHPGTGRL